MAPADASAGESSRAIPVPSTPAQSELEAADHSSTGGSSPPTHPAFYPRLDKGAGTTAGKENACPSPMAIPFSPFASPLVRLTAGKKKQTARGSATDAAEAAAPSRPCTHDCLADRSSSPGHGCGTPRDVLGFVDTNLVAPLPTKDKDVALETATTPKKNKRRSKKTNGVKNQEAKPRQGHGPSPPTSNAAAVKEDVAQVRKIEARTDTDADAKGYVSRSTKPVQVEEEEEEEEVVAVVGEQKEKEIAQDTAGDKDGKATQAGDMTLTDLVMAEKGAAETDTGITKDDTKDDTNGDGSGLADTCTGQAQELGAESETVKDQFEGAGVLSQVSTIVDYADMAAAGTDGGGAAAPWVDGVGPTEMAGLHWAPLRVPFRRRLQTLSVLFHCLCMGITLSVFFAFCAVPLFWPIIIVYLVSILFSTDAVDGKLRRRREWARRLAIWRYFAEYFPARLHKTHELVPTRKYILGYHPHGIISHGAWAAFATDALGFAALFPGITNSLLTLESNFKLPLYREYVFAMGALSVSKESISNVLTRGGDNGEGMGRAVTIVLGGARESLEAQPRTMRLIMKERKGFIKLAVRTGADVVPVLAFGENELYDQMDPHKHPWLHRLQRYFLKAWKFTVPLLHGRGIFNYDVGLMPYRRPLNIVVGKPIRVTQADRPNNSEVDRLHQLYTEELQKIWERYKDEFATHRREEMQFLD